MVTSEERMGFLLEHLNRQSKYALLMRGYLTVALITVADYATGPDTSFFVFYFFPIIVISWFVGRRHGLHMAFAAALGSSMHDFLFMSSFTLLSTSGLLTYWGLVQRSTVFLIVSITVAAMKSSEQKKRQLEYKIARQVQSFLMPRTVPSIPHFSCHAFTKASDHLSGDLFDCARLGPTKLGIIVGDVCGKGISAALLMAYLQGVLRSHAPLHSQTLDRLMRAVNRTLYASTAEEKFATLFIGVYDDTNRTLTYVNAGHEPPKVFRWNGMAVGRAPTNAALRNSRSRDSHHGLERLEIVKLEPGDLILGVDPSAVYTPRVQAMNLGDILVCTTDGVEEARNHLGEPYGLERLTRVVSARREESPRELCSLMMKDIEEFVGMEPQYDDMTLVIGKVV
jgi:serine phosphatase RsbU (regulator of sigma subunit)